MDKVSSWQKPFVDVFKRFNSFQCSLKARRGEVFIQQDNTIGRQIFKISGNVSASNYVIIPDPDSGVKNMGLVGRYIYLEFLPVKGNIFNIHLDFQIKGQENSTRFTISNMFESYKVTNGNILQIPFPKSAPEKYTVMVLDVQYHLENFGLFASSTIKNFDHIHQLKQVQICSYILFRGIYTSDNIYEIRSLPRELNFKKPKEGRTWSNDYQLVYYPTEIDPEFLNDMAKEGPPPVHEIQKEIQKSEDPMIKAQITEMKKSLSNLGSGFQQEEISSRDQIGGQNFQPQTQEFEQKSQILQQQQNFPQSTYTEDLAKRSFYSSTKPQQKKTQIDGLQPYPILKLNHILGFSGRNCPDIRFSKHPDFPHQIIYSSGSIVVVADLTSQNQIFFQGHTQPVACLDISRDGVQIVSAQEGPKTNIRLWDFVENTCISSWNAPYTAVKCVTFSYNRKLVATVGTDSMGRELIIIWNIDRIEEKKKPDILAKQVSDFNIISIKFSPIELDKLVSCGRENIRFWRIKNGHLPASAVVLNHHARNTVFTVMDYEFAYEEPSAAKQFGKVKRVFVGSKQGMLYQVNYTTHELEGVFKCHDSAICSLSLSVGFCISGSEDQYLRVWPLDFSEFLIEAKHEGIVISLDISQDALQVACGTSTGGLGVLDLSNHNYKTFLRSHTEEILQMVLHNFSNYLITLSSDLTIRIWDMQKYEQVYEFSYPSDDQCTCIAAYNQGMSFVGGFSSGAFRIFDIEKTSIIEECKFHDKPISCLQFSEDGRQLYVADQDSFYSVYDVTRNYQHVKTFEHEIPSEHQSISITQDSQTVATIGDSGTHINIWDTISFAPLLKLFLPNTQIQKLIFSSPTELFVLTTTSKIKVFNLSPKRQTLVPNNQRELNSVHRHKLSDVAFSENKKYLCSVGGDQLVKVWDYSFSLQGGGSQQVFVGHVSALNQCIFLGDKVWTCGGFEGIYEWSFLGNLIQEEEIDEQQYLEQEMYQPEEQPNSIQQEEEQQVFQQYSHSRRQEDQGDFQVTESEDEGQPRRQQPQQIQQQLSDHKVQYQEELVRSPRDEQQIQSQEQEVQGLIQADFQEQTQFQHNKMLTHTIELDFEPVTVDYLKQIKNREKGESKAPYTQNETRKKFNLPYRQYLIDRISKDLVDKIERIRENPKNFKLNTLIGYNNDCHDNLVWNFIKGFYAYSIENLLVIEQLNKERQQKIITLPDYISCMTFSRDYRYLIVGSASVNEKDQAAIQIIDTDLMAFKVIKTLNFHTRGVQNLRFSEDGKYLVSIGNFKECTVAVWDFKKYKLLASSYTLDKINDISISNKVYSSERLLEFMTVGRDQVQFWAFTKEHKLEYFDVFIPKTGQSNESENNDPNDQISEQSFGNSENVQKVSKVGGEFPELTCCDYIHNSGEQYAICGLKSGQVLLIKYGEFTITSRVQVFQGEINQINSSNQGDRVVLLSMDGFVGVWNFGGKIYNESEEFKPIFAQVKFPSAPICASFEPILNEALVGCIDGGIYYLNILNQYKSVLAGTIDTNVNYNIDVLGETYILSKHDNGKVSIWNILTGEQIISFNFKSPVTANYFNQSTQKLVFFFKNNNEIKVIDLKKLNKIETFAASEYISSDKVSNVYPIQAFENIIGGTLTRWILYNNGNLFAQNSGQKDRIQLQRLQKIFELKNAENIEVFSERSIIFVSSNIGTVDTYQVDFNSERKRQFSFTLIDEYNFYENPHGEIDNEGEQRELSQYLYKNAESTTKLAFDRVNQSQYVAINSILQYAFVRNFQKKQITARISLLDFPMSISICEVQASGLVKVLIGTQSGLVEKINMEDSEDKQSLQSMFDGAPSNVIALKKKNLAVLAQKSGICIYKI